MQKIFVAPGGSPIKESGLGSQLQDVSTCSVHHFIQAFYFLSLCYFFIRKKFIGFGEIHLTGS